MGWICRMDGQQPRTKRTLKSLVLRAVVPRVALFAGGAAILVLGQASVSPTASVSVAPSEEVAGVQPTWTLADSAAHPECTPSALWPAGTPAGHLVVEGARDGVHRKIAFDVAWRLNHDDIQGNDVWVLGVCG